MKQIIATVVAALAGILVGLAIVIVYEKGVATVKADLAGRWTRMKAGLVAWFKTSNPETT